MSIINHRVDISHKTIFFIAGFLALLWALFLIKEVIILLFIAIIFMSALSPIVTLLEKRLHFPRTLAIILIYAVIILIVGGLVSLVVTPLVEQTASLTKTLPKTVESLVPTQFVDKSVLQQEVTSISHNALTFTFEILSNFVALLSVAVLTAYLLIERGNLDKRIDQLFVGREVRVKKLVGKIEDKLGSWLRGQFILSLLIAVLCYVALFFAGVPYALPLAILAGLMEVVPVIGPIISAIPAVLVAYLSSPISAAVVGVSYLVIQQLEGHIIVPQVMKKAVGLNPLVVILAVAIGGKLLGIAGALLAVPITVVIQIIVDDVLHGDQST